MMRRRCLLLSLPLLLTLAAFCFEPQSQAEGPAAASKLPGARAAIEAINYPSLQAAFDALPETGGCVMLPAGKFEISEPLVLETEDVLIAGQGTATHIVNTNAEGKPALIIRPKDLAKDPKKMLWRVQLSNFRITGNEHSGHGIDALRVDEIFVQGVTVSYHGGDGIRLDHCTEDPRVCDSLITYNKQTGLKLLGCHDIVVASNHFEENQDGLQCLDGFNLCMTGNNIDDHLGNGVVIENTYGSVVSGNMIEECNGVGIILDRDCYGITLSANVIAHEMSGGIELRDAHGCSVSANSFPLVWKRSIYVGPESDRIAITGNAFSGSSIGDGKTKRPPGENHPGGIVLEGTKEITISGNNFSGLETKALALEGEPSRRVIFSGNVLSEVESDHENLVDSEVSANIASE
jgi:hypothetical protein